MTPAAPQVGKTYTVKSMRKGTFTGRVKASSPTWTTLEVVAGVADAMLAHNRAYPGDEVTVRNEFATFSEVAA